MAFQVSLSWELPLPHFTPCLPRTQTLLYHDRSLEERSALTKWDFLSELVSRSLPFMNRWLFVKLWLFPKTQHSKSCLYACTFLIKWKPWNFASVFPANRASFKLQKLCSCTFQSCFCSTVAASTVAEIVSEAQSHLLRKVLIDLLII